MNYNVVWTKKAKKQLSKMDKTTAKMIFSWIMNNLEGCENPRIHGKDLKGNHSGQWRYRIGDYRLICQIQDEQLVILALAVGHRKEIYE